MKKVIGIGETILDILFKGEQPLKAVPGGSVFNSMMSLGRMGVDARFISEVGNDRVGEIILNALADSGVDASSVCCFSDGISPLSLAFLNDNNDAEYLFYKNYPANRLEVEFPTIEADDVVLCGSYFVLNPVLRDKVKPFLQYARESGAIIYYDINYRPNHRHERIKLSEALIENLEFADVVRGSADDFAVLYDSRDGDAIYNQKIKFYCPNFIFTQGDGDVYIYNKEGKRALPVKKVDIVSTVGAGDNFNAGITYALLREGITRDALPTLPLDKWSEIVNCGLDFSAHACTLLENYVTKEWAKEYRNRG